MNSRRPMTRSFSGNGRTSSFSEEEGNSSNGRTESRNPYLSNVRPENSYSRYSHYRPTRSTLCSVMAQLTEDIQPSFDTTLKSRAVSENCNVKFTCVVSGYPAPELKWYKDDMELDRYCGLPKYEIGRNGKAHTLHIYNCTLDDAAIYQVSASNSKGIVSCSGVLEVGTMNEFQIHQRFFAKLKQKADKKKKDLEEHSKKRDKENTERPQRKRHIPAEKERPAVLQPEAEEQLGAAAEPNGVCSEVKEIVTVMSKDPDEKSPSEDTFAKKKIKITNGVDAVVDNSSRRSSRTNMMGVGGENCYDGGMGLAQFLAETLQSQAAEENHSSSRGEKPKEMDIPVGSVSEEKKEEQERTQNMVEAQDKVLEEGYERKMRREEEMAVEGEKERESLSKTSHTQAPYTKHRSEVKQHNKAHKDHDQPNIQASISSVLHTVKDFFFGKAKKDSHDHTESKKREFPDSHASMLPSFGLQPEQNEVPVLLTGDIVSMEVDKPKELSETVDTEQPSHEPREHKHEDPVPRTDQPLALKLSPGRVDVSTADATEEAMEKSLSHDGSSPGEEVLIEAEVKESVIKEVPVHQQKPDCLVVSPLSNQENVRDKSSSMEEMPVAPQTQDSYKEKYSFTSTPNGLENSWTCSHNLISRSNCLNCGEAPNETSQEEKMSIDKTGQEGEPDSEEDSSNNELCEEEKRNSVSQTSQITELTTCSLEKRTELCKSNTPDHILLLPPTVAAYDVERGDVKEQAECTSLIQEINVGFPTTDSPQSLEKGDLKMLQGCTFSLGEQSTHVHNINVIQSSNKGFQGSEEEIKLKDVLISALDVEVHSGNNLKPQEQVILEAQNAEEINQSLKSEVEIEKKNQVKDELNESKSLSVTQIQKGHVLEDYNKVANEESRERQQGQPSPNLPQIPKSTIDDNPDIKPPDKQNEQFVIPKIEIMEPELKECTLPVTTLGSNKQESDPANLEKHDTDSVSKIIIQDHSVVDSTSFLPMQKSMPNDTNLSLAGNFKEVVQLCDATKRLEREQSCLISSEQLPQMDCAPIPVINVLCTDHQEEDLNVNTHVSDTQLPLETPSVPFFVVPPISVTCYESDSGNTQNEWMETEASAATQRGTKPNVDNHNTSVSEKTQSGKLDLEEKTEKSIKGNTPSVLYEAPNPEVGDKVPPLSKSIEDNIVAEVLTTNHIKEAKKENSVSAEDLQRNRSSVERLCSKPPAHPSLSPASLRKFMSKTAADTEVAAVGDRQIDKAEDDLSGGSTPTSSLSCESSPRLKRRDSLSLIRSATPEELASGARRKIFIFKTKEDGEGAVVGALETQVRKENPYMSPSQARRAALLQAPSGQNTPPMERRSPLLSRRKATLEVPKVVEQTPTAEPVSPKQDEKPTEKKLNPLKAPQVLRKIRGEPFPDASGHLKLWCQFFNVLSDSTIKWYRDEKEILEVKRSGGDESQAALVIVLASSHDCGVYGCSIINEYGTDTTDFLLSTDILSGILLKDDLEVGEEIEMTPLLFNRGLADCGSWAAKYFGRIMTETVHIGEGFAHKASRVKVIYGLDPIFESGSACIIKVRSPIAYGTMQENNLTERNLQITKQECKVQNMIREYCKIFAAEARVIENFGFSLEVIAQYLMYRPANSVPYATVEAYSEGVFLTYCMIDPNGRLITRNVSEVEQKCCTFQHWIHQWTHGNLLVTRLEGVETKITNVRVVTKSKGYQGLTEQGSPEVFEQFQTHHQCNYYCGLLGLRSLKPLDNLQQPTKIKGSRSPLLNRKLGSNSPQLQRKGNSPQVSIKANPSPKVTRKNAETEDNKSGAKPKSAETVDNLEMR
ncbi:titin homolog isoform X2 [Pungitius pungitius]|uniref:titin homolog isoform X2 n=1 Tax=Pungitius pungitius TaxID=134920 RepID=UPI0018898F8B|nr:titin homolog isoform X2 [Pungitius pungitius]